MTRDVRVTVKQVQDRTSLSRSAAYELMHNLGAVRIGRALRLPSSVFERYLSQLTAASARTWESEALKTAAADVPSEVPARVPVPVAVETTPKTPTSSAQALLEQALLRGRKLRAARLGR